MEAGDLGREGYRFPGGWTVGGTGVYYSNIVLLKV